MSIWWTVSVKPEPVSRQHLTGRYSGGRMPDQRITDSGGWRRMWQRHNRGERDSYGEETLTLYVALGLDEQGQRWGCLARWRWELAGHDHLYWDHEKPLLFGHWHDTPEDVDVEHAIRTADPFSPSIPPQCPAWRWSAADVAEYRGLAHDMSARRWLAEQRITATGATIWGRGYPGHAVVLAAAAMSGRGHGSGRPRKIVSDPTQPYWWRSTYAAVGQLTNKQLLTAVVRLARAVAGGDTGVSVDDLAIHATMLSCQCLEPMSCAPSVPSPTDPRLPGIYRPIPYGQAARSQITTVVQIVRNQHDAGPRRSVSVFRSATAGQIRTVFGGGLASVADELAHHQLAILPAELPMDDNARVVIYETGSDVAGLLSAIAEQDESRTATILKRMTRHVVDGHPMPPQQPPSAFSAIH